MLSADQYLMTNLVQNHHSYNSERIVIPYNPPSLPKSVTTDQTLPKTAKL